MEDTIAATPDVRRIAPDERKQLGREDAEVAACTTPLPSPTPLAPPDDIPPPSDDWDGSGYSYFESPPPDTEVPPPSDSDPPGQQSTLGQQSEQSEQQQIEILLLRSHTDKATRRAGQRKTVSWSELAAMLTRHAILADKKAGRGFSPLTMADAPCTCGKMKDDKVTCPGKLGHFTEPNVIAFNVLMLDLDKYRDDKRQLDQAGAERSMARLRALNLQHIVYSTFNHGYPEHASLRSVIALSRPVTVEEWPLFFPAVTTWLDIEHDAECSETVGRFWYLPACPRDAEPIAYSVDGAPIDVDMIMSIAHARQAASAAKEAQKPRPEMARPHVPRGDKFSIRDLMTEKYPGVRGAAGGRDVDTRWDIGGSCPWQSEHTSSSTSTSTTVFLYASGAWEFICQHSHCRGRDHEDFRRFHQPDWTPYDERPQLPPRARRSDRTPPPEHEPDCEPGAELAPAAAPAEDHPNAPRDKLPVIEIGTKMREVVNASQDALRRAGGIYVRGTRLVHVVRDHSMPRWLKVPDGTSLIVEIGDTALRERMSATADWVKFDGRSESWKPALPPEWAPSALKERGEWTFPMLDGISDAPVLRPDGKIHDVPGYDPVSRTIFMPSRAWPEIKRNPTRHDASQALHELCDPLCDVTFAQPCHRFAAVAYFLTILGRSAIAGPVPMFASLSSTPGAGKGLTLDVGAIITTGRDAPKMLPTQNEEETRKRLLPIAVAAHPTVVIDNVEGSFGSPSLAAAVTSGTVDDRVLGTSTTKGVPLRTVFAVTGNNIQLHSDLGRRIIPIEIANDMEHPEDRVNFRYPRLKRHVTEIRPQLVVAGITLLRAFMEAGAPRHGGSEKGSFEEWDALIRGAIIWAGGADPCAGVKCLRQDGDSDLEKLRALIEAWRVCPAEVNGATTVELLARAASEPALRAAIDAYADPRRPMDSTVLGKRLAMLRNRPSAAGDGGQCYRIERLEEKAHGGVRRWCVVAITSAKEQH